MKQVRTVQHRLEMSDLRADWHPTHSGLDEEILRDAADLAWHGDVARALKAAEKAIVASRGHAHGVRFRVVTTETTVSFFGGFDQAEEFARRL